MASFNNNENDENHGAGGNNTGSRGGDRAMEQSPAPSDEGVDAVDKSSRDTNGVKKKEVAPPSATSPSEHPGDLKTGEETEEGERRRSPGADADAEMTQDGEAKDAASPYVQKNAGGYNGRKSDDDKRDDRDEDVEMRNYDTEDAEPHAGKEDKDGED